jgi:S1-C subfamily serine protease
MKRKLIAIILAATTILYGASYVATVANYKVNVNDQPLSTTVLNLNGSTYLSVRAVSEALGVPIEWNDSNKSVEIQTVDVDRLKESCVMIYAYGDGMTSQGSGVYVDYDEILTAYHVVDQGRNMIWDASDKTATFSAINFDSGIDIATLQASKEVKPVKIGDSDEVKVGDKVIAIGAPDDKDDTVIYATVKEVSAQLVISPAVKGGGSGGALFAMDGSLIGILIAADDNFNQTLVAPINDIRKAL